MSLLRYERLPRDYPNDFLSPEVTADDWSQVERYFADLQARSIETGKDVERWLRDYSELLRGVYEEGTLKYIRMTEQIENEEYRRAYLAYVEEIEPKVKVGQFNLNRKYIASGARKHLSRGTHSLIDRRIENSIRLFRDENVPLEKDEKGLAQKYQGIIGSMTVSYRGAEMTIPEITKFLEEPDRSVRKEAWTLAQDRMRGDHEQLDKIYDDLLALRSKIARNAGFDNYRDYAFLRRERFDYGPEDCVRFHKAVEEHIVPLLREVYNRRKETLGLDTLRPWDVMADPLRRLPLTPFNTIEELVRRCRRAIGEVNTELGVNFQRMIDLELLDLDSRPGKAPGGYNTELPQLHLPFIFANLVGRDDDLRVLLHESGHAFHIFEMNHRNLIYLDRGDSVPMEFAEVASMSMELLGGEHVEGIFYDKEAADRSKYDHFRGIAVLLAWIATIDAFQHWVYTNPEHSHEDRSAAWIGIHERFSLGEDWNGLEEVRQTYWHKQLHLFELPFYYIEYGIAQLGALGIWLRYLKEPSEAVADYRRSLSLGGSKSLPELFRTAGLPWGFGPETVERCTQELRRILA